jgi:hypothetical protein
MRHPVSKWHLCLGWLVSVLVGRHLLRSSDRILLRPR